MKSLAIAVGGIFLATCGVSSPTWSQTINCHGVRGTSQVLTLTLNEKAGTVTDERGEEFKAKFTDAAIDWKKVVDEELANDFHLNRYTGVLRMTNVDPRGIRDNSHSPIFDYQCEAATKKF